MNSSRFFVLGSNSFSGSHFVKYLLQKGHQVIGASRSEEVADAFAPYRPLVQGDNFKYLQLDVNKNLPEIMSVLGDFKPEYVVNFAAQSMVAESWTNPEHWFMTNVVSQVKWHDQLRKLPFLQKYVHISTPEVYGSCSGWVKEDNPFNPSTPYAVSRAAADMSLLSFLKNYKFPVVFTRAANVYGPGQQLYRIIPRTILSLRDGSRKLQLHGGGVSVRSFIHIDDVCTGTYLATVKGQPGDVFHLSTTEQISIRNLVENLCALGGSDFSKTVDVAPERPGKDLAYLLDSTKANKDLGWTANIGLEQGLKETIQWVDKYWSFLKAQPWDYQHKE